MTTIFFDVEADGLLEQATKVHCIATSVNGTSPHLLSIEESLWLMNKADQLVGHNIIAYDIPLLYKLLGFKTRKDQKIVDTWLIAKLLDPDNMEGHSLEVLGKKYGEHKGDFKGPWTEYTEEMGSYCKQDVRTLIAIYNEQQREITTNKKIKWDRAIEIEHQFAKDFAVQGMRGVMVDVAKAQHYVNDWSRMMDKIEKDVEPRLPLIEPTQGYLRSVTPPAKQFKKDGTPSLHATKWFDKVEWHDTPEDGGEVGGWFGTKHGLKLRMPVVGPMVTKVPMKLHNQVELKDWLMECGWIPSMWSYKKEKDSNGKMRVVRDQDGPVKLHPKIHDKGVLCKGLEQIKDDFPLAKDVAKWMIIRHRRGLVEGILRNVRANGTVPATGMSLGTPTSRVAHAIVANIPKAEKDVYLGKECRSIFIPRKGRVMVGADASGLELRMLANRAPSPLLIHAVTSGTKENADDIHSILHKACAEYVRDRTTQKNVNYAWLYGATDPKLGQTALHPDKDCKAAGEAIRERLVSALPGLDELMEGCKRASERGWIKGLDGRRIPLRGRHATLNTLLQSDGSIVVKYATNFANDGIRWAELRGFQVIHYHDEVQFDCNADDAAQIGDFFIQGLKAAEKCFKLNCPLDGEVKIGQSWADTH